MSKCLYILTKQAVTYSKEDFLQAYFKISLSPFTYKIFITILFKHYNILLSTDTDL